MENQPQSKKINKLVIVIIIILSFIAVAFISLPIISKISEKMLENKKETAHYNIQKIQIKQIQHKIEMYNRQNKKFPNSLQEINVFQEDYDGGPYEYTLKNGNNYELCFLGKNGRECATHDALY